MLKKYQCKSKNKTNFKIVHKLIHSKMWKIDRIIGKTERLTGKIDGYIELTLIII